VAGEWRAVSVLHFSGFNAERPETVSRHQDRFQLVGLDHSTQPLFLDYADALLQRGYAECKNWPYAYGAFANGEPIPDAARQRHEIVEPTADPFSEKAYRDFVRSMVAPTDAGGLRPLAAEICRSRPDLQKAFPDPQGEDRERFLRWLLTFGASEH